MLRPMSKSERLLGLLQALRAHRRPVSAERLAEELQVSVRTIYRDVVALNSQGATIEGEAGIGYVLRPGFLLPPLMFGDDEIEALVLGSRWVMQRGDRTLAGAARHALTKIAAVLPEDLKERIELTGMMVAPRYPDEPEPVDLAPIRAAIREEVKLKIAYCDEKGQRSDRVIWPIALAFFDRARVVAAWCELRQVLLDGALFAPLYGRDAPTDLVDIAAVRAAIGQRRKLEVRYRDESGQDTQRMIWPIGMTFYDRVRIVIAWCELRQDFRHFRADRIEKARALKQRYPKRRRVLLKDWRISQNIPEQF